MMVDEELERRVAALEERIDGCELELPGGGEISRGWVVFAFAVAGIFLFFVAVWIVSLIQDAQASAITGIDECFVSLENPLINLRLNNLEGNCYEDLKKYYCSVNITVNRGSSCEPA